ncbi:MAG: hypothetical protein JXQ71_00530 [Verrucomicrobia bacterium]|nr:hypothetical protein [Verrucomicrobiota bacterium]
MQARLPSARAALSIFLIAGAGVPLLGAAPFDAAPFALPLPKGNGLLWEDPREIHRVVAHFADAAPAPETVRLEYWGSWWPDRHLPKDREPGGGNIGWMELGNWWKYDWRVADTEAVAHGKAIVFAFRPVNAKEFPKLREYPAAFRYTLKLRVASDRPLPVLERLEAFTDSGTEPRAVRLVWDAPLSEPPTLEAFNGRVLSTERRAPSDYRVYLNVVTNADPNTFDRTLLTVRQGSTAFTLKFDDLLRGPLFMPHVGVIAQLAGDDRSYAELGAEQQRRGTPTLHDRVAALPEQTWRAAWEGMPPKKSHIYFPLGLDGGRQRFRLNADGSLDWRSNDHYLRNRPGRDTPRLSLEKGGVQLRFGLPSKPSHRTLEEASLPICATTWHLDGVRVQQRAFVTELEGGTARTEALTPWAHPGREPDAAAPHTAPPPSKERARTTHASTPAANPAPPGDAFAVFMAHFAFTNTTGESKSVALPLEFGGGPAFDRLRLDGAGLIWNGDHVRGHVSGFAGGATTEGEPGWRWTLGPHEARAVVVKVPYVVLTSGREHDALRRLDFDTERKAVAGYWRQRLNQSASLITPEPMLNEFYRSHAMHLLVNCEREPGSDRRFARVGSFGYGAYGNESCMMVVDLERRGYHREARDCLDAWLHYQGTVALPGSFASKDGVLYGAGGYEAGGYNQHHGWILWMLGEHYRFTRDQAWLERAAGGIVKGADWIIRETARTADRHELERGLLPSGSLEDIGDWWTWLSTSCYTWRGLDSAAWALEQIRHPEARRLRQAATDYHHALIANFTTAMERSPVVRLRDGTAIPKVPSHVHRRGRTFGWICETLEGALHLLITRAIDPNSNLGTWIVKDYEDNLYLSNQYGYTLDNFERHWFGRGGMSMQACLLLDVEPYLFRDEPKHALRALFNGQAVSYFPDVRLNTEHALPAMGDWRGDHFKSSDEANCAGWLRHLFVREQDDRTLLVGQAVPREWLAPNRHCGMEKAATWFGPVSVLYTGGDRDLLCQLKGPTRNPPETLRVRFRHPRALPIRSATLNGNPWPSFGGEWVTLPGNIGDATLTATFPASP